MTAKESLEQALKEENPDRPLIKEEIEAGVYSFALKIIEGYARLKCKEQKKICLECLPENPEMWRYTNLISNCKNACDE